MLRPCITTGIAVIFLLTSSFGKDRHKLDSLLNRYHNTEINDTLLPHLTNEIGSLYKAYNLDSALIYSWKCVEYAKNQSKAKEEARAYLRIGKVESHFGRHDSSLFAFEQAKKLYIQLGDPIMLLKSSYMIGVECRVSGQYEKAEQVLKDVLLKATAEKDTTYIISALDGLANIARYTARYDQAVDYFIEAIDLGDKSRNIKLLPRLYNNLCIVYNYLGEEALELKYMKKTVDAMEILGDEIQLVRVYNGYGGKLLNLDSTDQGKRYINKSYELLQKHGVERVGYKFVGGIYTNKAAVAYDEGHYNEALNWYQKAYNMRVKSGEKKGISTSLRNLGRYYLHRKKYQTAIDYFNRSLKLVLELGYVHGEIDDRKYLARCYSHLGHYRHAYDELWRYTILRDSTLKKESADRMAEMEARFESSKKDAAIKMLSMSQKVDKMELDKQQMLIDSSKQEMKNQRLLSLLLILGLLSIAAVAFVIFKRYKDKKRANDIISNTNQLLVQKNKEITDSITYAKRIQSAILPPLKLVKEYLHESFILYKPKDIVAGDFYWLQQISSPPAKGEYPKGEGVIPPAKGNHPVSHSADTPPLKGGEYHPVSSSHPSFAGGECVVYFAAADCTGHGVPGAMVSVVCNNALNRAVREYGLTDPGQILDKARELVVAEFEKSEEDVKDGMDISLCSINGNHLLWAGANNPLWLIRKDENGVAELVEVKPDKQPIGKYADAKPFTTHKIELQKGDSIYIFSDGFADQFGGPKGKKLKSKNFKQLLLSIQDKTMEEQHSIIDKKFEEWRGDLEQVDDVCVIGVRL